MLGYYLDEKTGVTSNFLPAEGSLLPNPNGRVRRSFFSGEPNNDHFDTEQWAVSYFLEHRFNDVWRVRQNARYGRIDLDFTSLYGTGLDPTDPTKRLFLRNAFFSDEFVGQFVIDNQAQANFSTGAIDHTLLMGVDYQNNQFKQLSGDGPASPIDMYKPVYGEFVDPPPLFADADITLAQTGTYIQDQAKFFDRFILVAGGRYDWARNVVDDHLWGADTEQNDEGFTWRVGGVYLGPYGISPYASYATSFLPISGFDPFTGSPFDPETGQQYEAGIKFQPEGRKTLMTFSAFDIRRQNYLTYDNLFNPRQTGEILSRGLEFETVAELWKGVDFIAAYTWLPEFTITETQRSARAQQARADRPRADGLSLVTLPLRPRAVQRFRLRRRRPLYRRDLRRQHQQRTDDRARDHSVRRRDRLRGWRLALRRQCHQSRGRDLHRLVLGHLLLRRRAHDHRHDQAQVVIDLAGNATDDY